MGGIIALFGILLTAFLIINDITGVGIADDPLLVVTIPTIAAGTGILSSGVVLFSGEEE